MITPETFLPRKRYFKSYSHSSSHTSSGGSSVEFPPSEVILTAILIAIFIIACVLVKRHEDQNS